MDEEEKRAKLVELQKKINQLPGYSMRLPLTPEEKMLEYLLKPFEDMSTEERDALNEAIEIHSNYPVTPKQGVRWVENGYIDERGMWVFVGDGTKADPANTQDGAE